MAPFTFEAQVLPHIGADERGVRECRTCPPWMECAHFGDECVRLVDHQRVCNVCPCGFHPGVRLVTVLSGVLDGTPRPGDHPCPGWHGRQDVDSTELDATFPTEAEARAEFERRVAAMLGREVE